MIELIGNAKQIIQFVPQSTDSTTMTVVQNVASATVIISPPLGAAPLVVTVTSTTMGTSASATPLTPAEIQALNLDSELLSYYGQFLQMSGKDPNGYISTLADIMGSITKDPSAVASVIQDTMEEIASYFWGVVTYVGELPIIPSLLDINGYVGSVSTPSGTQQFTVAVSPN